MLAFYDKFYMMGLCIIGFFGSVLCDEVSVFCHCEERFLRRGNPVRLMRRGNRNDREWAARNGDIGFVIDFISVVTVKKPVMQGFYEVLLKI